MRYSGFSSFNSTPITSHPGIRRVWCVRCHSWAMQRGPARGVNVVMRRYWCRPSSMTCVSCMTERWACLRTSDSTPTDMLCVGLCATHVVCLCRLAHCVRADDADRLEVGMAAHVWCTIPVCCDGWSRLLWSVRRC